MELIVKYYDGINTRSICIQKELNKLNYLLELKKSKSISSVSEEEDKKLYETKQKMYFYKLNSQQILNPKLQTLEYYKIKVENDTYFLEN